MAIDETLHTRVFTLTVEFTDADREVFMERMAWSPEDGGISDAIISEVTSDLEDVGLRPTVERVH